MAADGNHQGMLRRLEAEVSCPLCLEVFTDPRRLPCDHVYCRECLRGMAVRSTTGSICCPECRKDAIVPNYNIANFPASLAIVRLVDMYREYLQSAETETSAPQPIAASCKVHGAQPLDLYCETCERLVCRDCALLYCSKGNHKFAFIDEMVEKYRSELDGELQPIRMLHQQISGVLKAVSAGEKELQTLKEEKKQKVHSTFDTLSEILAEERRFFAESIDKSFQEQENIVAAKKSKISERMTKLELLIQSIENASQNESNQVFLASMADKKRNIEHAKKTEDESSSVKPPTTEVQLCDSKEFKDFFQMKNFMYERNDVSKSHMERSLDNVQVNKTSNFALYLDPQGVKRSLFGRVNIEAQLHCSQSGLIRIVIVRELSPEKYSLSFTPLERGKHLLHIKYNGMHIYGSPIPICVDIRPEELKRLSRMSFKSKKVDGVAGLKHR